MSGGVGFSTDNCTSDDALPGATSRNTDTTDVAGESEPTSWLAGNGDVGYRSDPSRRTSSNSGSSESVGEMAPVGDSVRMGVLIGMGKSIGMGESVEGMSNGTGI